MGKSSFEVIKIPNWELEYFMIFVVAEEDREKMKSSIIGRRPLFKEEADAPARTREDFTS